MSNPDIIVSAKNTVESAFDSQFVDGDKLLIAKESKTISLLSNGEITNLSAVPLLNIMSASFGYLDIPTGSTTLIVQWGKRSVNANSVTSFSFPKPFPTACLNIMASQSENDFITGLKVRAIDNLTHEISVQGGVSTEIISWIAIGY